LTSGPGLAGSPGGGSQRDRTGLVADPTGESPAAETAYVFTSGDEGATPAVPAGALVIAADGGAERALAAGFTVDLAVGDLDSIAPETLAALEHAGARIERHPTAKDKTDLELALDAALEAGASRIVVVGGSAGRLDHLLGGLLLLASDTYAAAEIDALIGPASVHVLRRARTLAGTPGETISLLPVGGPARGVTTAGLRYPLRGETLAAGTSRGSSNVFASTEARISLAEGILLAVRPGS
jgi:thiamine pyrophosphokinase